MLFFSSVNAHLIAGPLDGLIVPIKDAVTHIAIRRGGHWFSYVSEEAGGVATILPISISANYGVVEAEGEQAKYVYEREIPPREMQGLK